jgi:putative membrane protein
MMRVDDGLRRDLVAAVQTIEKCSAAEVVVTVVPHAAAHWDVALGAALAAVFLLQAVVAAFFADASALQVALDSAAVALAVVALVRGLPLLGRLLLPRRVAARRVEVGAESAFCRQGIFRTRARTGVLLYVALLERRAVLLLDDAVARALPAEALDALRAETAALFSRSDSRAALLALLDHLRRLGARHLPRALDDVNELPDAPVTE